MILQNDHVSSVLAGQAGPCNAAVSPEGLAHLPQSRLLPLLMRRAEEQPSLIRILMGHTVERYYYAPTEFSSFGGFGFTPHFRLERAIVNSIALLFPQFRSPEGGSAGLRAWPIVRASASLLLLPRGS